jgi:hypothetical protein
VALGLNSIRSIEINSSTSLILQLDELNAAPTSTPQSVWRKILRFILETDEQEDPSRCGHRISLRRVFLFVGSLAYLYGAIDDIIRASQLNVKSALEGALRMIGVVLDWPPGDTIFDNVFATYRSASILQSILGLLVSVFCIIAFSLFFNTVFIGRCLFRCSKRH